MDELERVIYDLERCTCHVPDACRDCSKYASETGLKCMENLMMDALELLKEQEQQIEQLEHDLAVTQNNLNYYVNGND
jgi:hypothetical protein